MDEGLLQWIQSQVNGVRNGFRKMRGMPSVEEEQRGKLISPIPDSERVDMQPPSFEHATPEAMKSMKFAGQSPMMGEFAGDEAENPAVPEEPETPPINEVRAQAKADSQSKVLNDFTKYRESGDFEIPPLPDEISQQIQETFGKEAGRAAVVAGTENPSYDPKAQYVNPGGRGTDIGIFQINTNTLTDFLRRHPKEFNKIGVDSPDDLYDPIKNIKVAKIIMDEQGWNAWYGPRNKGYNVYDK